MSAPRSAAGGARDRRGRGVRGPSGRPGASPAATFDGWVGSAAARLRHHVGGDMDTVQVGVEEVPVLPDDWQREVPMSAHLPGRGRRPARIVVYRLPVAGRVRGRLETTSLVLDLLVEEAADLLGRDPDDLDPRLA